MTDIENVPPPQDSEREALASSSPNDNAPTLENVARESLTPLTKVLLVIALFLLLLSSVFIGLFAGAQHRLSTGGGGRGGGSQRDKERMVTTTTRTRMGTTTATGTTTTTTTTATHTSVTTTTTRTTTMVTMPAPVPTTPPLEKPCLDTACVILAGSILGGLDVTQDPCENFYDFANGGWLKAHPLPADKERFGAFDAVAQHNRQVIKKILEDSHTASTSAHDYDAETLKKLGDQYFSCLDEKHLNDIGDEPLRQVVKVVTRLYRGEDADTTLGFLEEQAEWELEHRFNGLTAAVAYMHSRKISALFKFDVEGDVGHDPNFMVPWFSQPSLGLPSKEYYQEENIKEIYTETIAKLLESVLDILDDGKWDQYDNEGLVGSRKRLLDNYGPETWPPWPWPPWGGEGDDEPDDGGEPDEEDRHARARKLAKKVVKFERKIAKASLNLTILHQDPIATYNPVPLSTLTSALPQIEFLAYFSTFNPTAFPDRVILTYPSYPASLSGILEETPKEVIEAYLVTRVLLKLSPFLGSETKQWMAHRRLFETLTGIKKGAVGDRAEWCVSRVEETLGYAAGRFFVNQTFAGESKKRGTALIKGVIETFKNSLKNIDWMDKESAKAAGEKADAIRIKVGYPESPDTLSARSIAIYYRTVKIDSSRFFENMLSAASSNEYKKWLELGKLRDPLAWGMYPSTVNAYFNPPSNEIVFPAGILQPPFFKSGWPGYLTYGAFGQVAAHELTHAFDSAGRLYNQKGKLEKWWTNSTSEGFKIKQKCIVDQFAKFKIDDGKGGYIHINGNLTSGENIGDSGLIQAYRAWKAQFPTSLKNGGEYMLPGLTYTRDQLFFIAFARLWASAMKPAAAVRQVRTNPHSPARFRVDGTVSNIPQFAEAFKCSKTAKLNPPQDKRCIFWG